MCDTFAIGATVYDRGGRKLIVVERKESFKESSDTTYVSCPGDPGACWPMLTKDLSYERPECFAKIIDDMRADPSVPDSYAERLEAYAVRFAQSPTFSLL